MDNIKKSHVVKLLLIATLILITPLLSSSLRTPYLYFIVNLLIIALGADAGLLSFFTKPSHDHHKIKPSLDHTTNKQESTTTSPNVITNNGTIITTLEYHTTRKTGISDSECLRKRVVEKCASEKIVSVAKLAQRAAVKKCPSTPSLFFIGGAVEDDYEVEDDRVVNDDQDHDQADKEKLEDLSGQELFHKAETFIGNFYKQLKIQREDSWKRLHDFYQKAF